MVSQAEYSEGALAWHDYLEDGGDPTNKAAFREYKSRYVNNEYPFMPDTNDDHPFSSLPDIADSPEYPAILEARRIAEKAEKRTTMKKTRQSKKEEQMNSIKMAKHEKATEREIEMEPGMLDSVLSNLKPEIKAFLFSNLPPKTTLAEFEDFAVELYDKIRDLWEKA